MFMCKGAGANIVTLWSFLTATIGALAYLAVARLRRAYRSTLRCAALDDKEDPTHVATPWAAQAIGEWR